MVRAVPCRDRYVSPAFRSYATFADGPASEPSAARFRRCARKRIRGAQRRASGSDARGAELQSAPAAGTDRAPQTSSCFRPCRAPRGRRLAPPLRPGHVLVSGFFYSEMRDCRKMGLPLYRVMAVCNPWDRATRMASTAVVITSSTMRRSDLGNFSST